MSETQAQPAKRRGRPRGSESARNRERVTKLVQTVPGISIREIAEETGLAKNTIQTMMDKHQIIKAELDAYKTYQPDVLLNLSRRISESIDDECIKKAPLKDRMVGLGIAIDKFRLITGESTGNVNNWLMIVQQSQAPVTNRAQHANPDPITVDITGT